MKPMILLFAFVAIFAIAINADDENGCWRPTYGRGVGKPISACADGMDKDAGLCYSKCDGGYHGVGPVCWRICPNGFTVN
uniref:Uncharacterized protein n=1 Tax=Panagrolaimus sp. ES5 TaxID=591445 RepID=A0AC34F3W2_9BILA